MKHTANRFLLREMTRPHHEKLDAEVGSLENEAAYRRYLAGISQFRFSVEPALQAADYPASFGDWRPGFVESELYLDCSDLDLPPANAPSSVDLPDSISGLLGMLYVLEGSSLGARLLVRQAAALGYDGRFGARHLVKQTADTSSWTAFQSILESAADFDLDAAGAAAASTFGHARQAFEQVRHAEA